MFTMSGRRIARSKRREGPARAVPIGRPDPGGIRESLQGRIAYHQQHAKNRDLPAGERLWHKRRIKVLRENLAWQLKLEFWQRRVMSKAEP